MPNTKNKALAMLDQVIRGVVKIVETAQSKRGLVSGHWKMRRNEPIESRPAAKQLHEFTFNFTNGKTIEITIAERDPPVASGAN